MKIFSPEQYIITKDKELSEVISNGYDLRLGHDELLKWMKSYAEYVSGKLKEERNRIWLRRK